MAPSTIPLPRTSLSTYLEYATRTKLRPDRTVYIGTHYEYTAAEALLRLGFSLIRTGQKNDAGIDLIGHWMLSFLREPMPVIVQCKSRMKTCSPNEVRELEGAFQSVPPEWRSKDVLGLLITNQKATEGLRKQMYLSTRPLAFLQISKNGIITQFVWNRAAAERGLEGVGVTPRYTVLPPGESDKELEMYRCEDRPRDAHGRFLNDPYAKLRKKGASRTVITDIQLTWLGTPVFPDQDELTLETAKRMVAIAQAHGIAHMGLKKPAKPKRGRPPGSKNKNGYKPRVEAVKKKRRQSVSRNEVKVTAASVTKSQGEGRVGRPSKAVRDAFGDDGSGVIVARPVPPKRGRGRPPKSESVKKASKQMSNDSVRSKDVPLESATPRKRGRPRKTVAVPDG
ncbi:uncharacterized protein N0V89_005275 [Didymosphaeria variabile]|uniref:Restriction endonuclease type IV Mrr domain-containing protein n=1 Tax=Didymosphaeria variabile TaxID=1932322 RepID=A0A9W8XKH7_9PLEO|nr:uncharacterized protein N0V89_005275 [Didymosphaeria variabile]KAJ4353545.1 hypothetical protein N0V89_005275 [Didymosphaeria variabile]